MFIEKKQLKLLSVLFVIAFFYLAIYIYYMFFVFDVRRFKYHYREPNRLLDMHENRPHSDNYFILLSLFPLVITFVFYFFFGRNKNITNIASGLNSSEYTFVRLEKKKEAEWSMLKTIVVFIFASILCLVLFFLLNSKYSHICIYNPKEFADYCDFTNDFVTRMNKIFGNNESVWLLNGTLLAVMRNQSDTNYLIYNDHDFDLCYDKKYMGTVVDDLSKFNDIFWESVVSEHHNLSYERVYSKRHLNLLQGQSGSLMIEWVACEKKNVTPAIGCNNHIFNVATDATLYLEQTYGLDWRVRKNYNHNGLCRFFPNW